MCSYNDNAVFLGKASVCLAKQITLKMVNNRQAGIFERFMAIEI